MRWSSVILFIAILSAIASNGFSAEPNWPGQYADKNFLNGQAVFQMSIEQSGNVIHISFDAAYSDAHGAAPDGEGQAKITGKNKLQFNWEDSFKNSGTGTITLAGKDIVVSMNTTQVIDPRCLVFYGRNMRLKRVKKGRVIALRLQDAAARRPYLHHRAKTTDHFLQTPGDLA
jgi:hypothetical protein